jgi:hypothetical protein
MDYDHFWGDNDGDGPVMAKAHGLKSPQPIMCSSLESDNCLYMLQSGSKYYIWNLIEGGVWEFMKMRRESRVSRTGAEVEPGLSRAEQNRWGRRWAGVKIPVVLQYEH